MVSANLPGIALIGNPGTGKSTILNGLVGKSVFDSGISYGTGRTTHLQEYIHTDGRSYFDTPGLDDIDKRKEAGVEIDKLLKEDNPLKIVFVVFVINGRARPEDAATVRLVLDSIKAITDNQFGVVINQAQERVVNAMKGDKFIEKKVRTSITGNRHTQHWCYVTSNSELDGKDHCQLMTPELRQFFDNIPETRAKGVQVKKVDTDSFEEKLEQEKKRFEEREKLLQQELETQNRRTEMLESLTKELKNSLKLEQASNRERQAEFRKHNEQLREMINGQKKEIQLAQEQAENIRGDFSDFKRLAEENKEKAQRDFEMLKEWQMEEKVQWEGEVERLQGEITELEKKKICVIM